MSLQTIANELSVITRVTGVDEFSKQLKDGVVKTKDNIKDLTKTLSDKLSEQFDIIKDKATDTLESIDGKAEATGSFMEATLSGHRDTLMSIGDSYKNFFKGSSKEQEKAYKDMTKNLQSLRYNAEVFSQSTGIAADDVVNFSKTMTMLTGDNNGMNKFLKETLSTDWQTFAKGLNISGVSMEDFGNTYSNVYTKLGKDSKIANTQLKKFFAMGGDAISTTKKIAAASDLMEGYGEVAQKLTGGIWDTNDMDNYTDSYLKNMHILMKTAKMNDQEAMDSAKQIATLTSMLQSNNNQALIFDDEDTFQRLITTGGLFQNIFENSGDFQKMLKEEGFAGVIGKLQQKFVGADGVFRRDDFIKAYNTQLRPVLNKILPDIATGEAGDQFTELISKPLYDYKETITQYNEANKDLTKNMANVGKDFNKYVNKNFKSTLVTAEQYASYMENLGDNMLVNLTYKEADAYIRKHAKTVYDYTKTAVDMAKEGDTYLLGDIVKKYSAVKRMGVMGLFVQANGEISDMQKNLGGLLDVIQDGIIKSTSFITMLGTLGFRFQHLGLLASPVTKSFGVLNNMTFGLMGSMGKLTLFVGGVAAVFNKIGWDNINNLLEGNVDFSTSIGDKLAYDISRMAFKKNMAGSMKEFETALSNQKGDINKIILNNKIFKDAFEKNDKNAMALITKRYGEIDKELLKTQEGRNQLLKKYTDNNNKVASDILQSRISIFIDNAVKYVNAGLEIAGKTFKLLYKKITDTIFGVKDENGAYLVEPLWIRLKNGILGIFNKISSGELFGNTDSDAFKNKLIGFLGIALGYALLSGDIRRSLFTAVTSLFTSTFALATKPIAAAFSGLFDSLTGKNGLLGMALTIPIAFYGVGKAWDYITGLFGSSEKRAEVLVGIETKLNMKAGTLKPLNDALNNIGDFINTKIIPTIQSVFKTVTDFFMNTVIPTMKNVVTSSLEAVKTSLKTFVESTVHTGGLILTYDIMPKVKDTFDFVEKTFRDQIVPIAGSIGEIVSGYFKKALDSMGDFWSIFDGEEGLLSFFFRLKSDLLLFTDTLAPSIAKMISSVVENAIPILSKLILAGITVGFSSVFDAFTSKTGYLVMAIGGGFLLLKNMIIPYFKEIASTYKASIGMAAREKSVLKLADKRLAYETTYGKEDIRTQRAIKQYNEANKKQIEAQEKIRETYINSNNPVSVLKAAHRGEKIGQFLGNTTQSIGKVKDFMKNNGTQLAMAGLSFATNITQVIADGFNGFRAMDLASDVVMAINPLAGMAIKAALWITEKIWDKVANDDTVQIGKEEFYKKINSPEFLAQLRLIQSDLLGFGLYNAEARRQMTEKSFSLFNKDLFANGGFWDDGELKLKLKEAFDIMGDKIFTKDVMAREGIIATKDFMDNLFAQNDKLLRGEAKTMEDNLVDMSMGVDDYYKQLIEIQSNFSRTWESSIGQNIIATADTTDKLKAIFDRMREGIKENDNNIKTAMNVINSLKFGRFMDVVDMYLSLEDTVIKKAKEEQKKALMATGVSEEDAIRKTDRSNTGNIAKDIAYYKNQNMGIISDSVSKRMLGNILETQDKTAFMSQLAQLRSGDYITKLSKDMQISEEETKNFIKKGFEQTTGKSFATYENIFDFVGSQNSDQLEYVRKSIDSFAVKNSKSFEQAVKDASIRSKITSKSLGEAENIFKTYSNSKTGRVDIDNYLRGMTDEEAVKFLDGSYTPEENTSLKNNSFAYQMQKAAAYEFLQKKGVFEANYKIIGAGEEMTPYKQQQIANQNFMEKEGKKIYNLGNQIASKDVLNANDQKTAFDFAVNLGNVTSNNVSVMNYQQTGEEFMKFTANMQIALDNLDKEAKDKIQSNFLNSINKNEELVTELDLSQSQRQEMLQMKSINDFNTFSQGLNDIQRKNLLLAMQSFQYSSDGLAEITKKNMQGLAYEITKFVGKTVTKAKDMMDIIQLNMNKKEYKEKVEYLKQIMIGSLDYDSSIDLKEFESKNIKKWADSFEKDKITNNQDLFGLIAESRLSITDVQKLKGEFSTYIKEQQKKYLIENANRKTGGKKEEKAINKELVEKRAKKAREEALKDTAINSDAFTTFLVDNVKDNKLQSTYTNLFSSFAGYDNYKDLLSNTELKSAYDSKNKGFVNILKEAIANEKTKKEMSGPTKENAVKSEGGLSEKPQQTQQEFFSKYTAETDNAERVSTAFDAMAENIKSLASIMGGTLTVQVVNMPSQPIIQKK